jgi:hypothetical protein
MRFYLHVCSVSAGSSSASKETVKRLPGGKVRKKVGFLTVPTFINSLYNPGIDKPWLEILLFFGVLRINMSSESCTLVPLSNIQDNQAHCQVQQSSNSLFSLSWNVYFTVFFWFRFETAQVLYRTFLIFVLLDIISLVTTFFFGLQEKQEVVIEKIVRNKRKCVTVVKGLELFGKLCSHKCLWGRWLHRSTVKLVIWKERPFLEILWWQLFSYRSYVLSWNLGVKLSDASKKLGKKFATGSSVVKVYCCFLLFYCAFLFLRSIVQTHLCFRSSGSNREGTNWCARGHIIWHCGFHYGHMAWCNYL